MKIAHFSIWGPNRCGLFETTRDLILAERSVGIDARMIACHRDTFKWLEPQSDNGFKSEKLLWSFNSDIIVRHTCIPTQVQSAGIPIAMAMHGRPESSARLECKDGEHTPIIRIYAEKIHDQRHKAFFTFWPEHLDVWSNIIPKNKLFYVPACVDLNKYARTEKRSPWRGPWNGFPNILIPDVWREDVIPFNVIFAAAKFARKYKKAKIHICGCPVDYQKVMVPFFSQLRQEGILGFVSGQIREIKQMYGGADMVVTPHVIATRVIRESLSFGIPVVAGEGCKYTPYTANPNDIDAFADAIERCWSDPVDDYEPRKMAEENFSYEKTGEAMKDVINAILKRKDKRRKVFIDVGAHKGESIRRFYQDVPDAREYEIYAFEPDEDNYTFIDTFFPRMHNLNPIKACAGTVDGMVDFYRGEVHDNEGGTTEPNKCTGGVQYGSPTKVLSIDFARWLRENINPGDHVLLKINIEGGEYPLMEMLLDKDLTGMIDTAYIQLHAHKFPHGQQRQNYQRIESRFWNEAKCKRDLDNSGHHNFRK